jgi:hypothetical protein
MRNPQTCNNPAKPLTLEQQAKAIISTWPPAQRNKALAMIKPERKLRRIK